jgi:hypothetical protein
VNRKSWAFLVTPLSAALIFGAGAPEANDTPPVPRFERVALPAEIAPGIGKWIREHDTNRHAKRFHSLLH